jgi:hypothetical protein
MKSPIFSKTIEIGPPLNYSYKPVWLPGSGLSCIKWCVIAIKENKMNTDNQNLSVLAKVTQVSDVTHEPVASRIFERENLPETKPISAKFGLQ